MAAYGTTADLIVASRGSGDDFALRSILEAVLLETGRPLLIPSAAAPAVMMTEKIAIAWKATAEAAGAVALAMPFLTRTKEIAVMTVEEEEGRRDDADRLVRSLAWHGLSATVERLTPGAHGAAETLLGAVANKAGLLDHGRVRPQPPQGMVFGGFTQRVLADAPLPVLIAH